MKNLPPGYNPNQPFGQPKNDFPITASISPSKGDPGTMVTVNAMAAGQANALMVLFVRFFDKAHHGMRAAKFADALGRVTFNGPIPNDAPVGVATVVVAASTNQNKSAQALTKFTVTGPGCQ